MAWFWRILLQWIVIAIFACIPFAWQAGWPFTGIISGIVVFGLLTYGISNPAYAFRRAFIWGSVSVISASLSPPASYEPLKHVVSSWNLPVYIFSFIDGLLFFFLERSVSWYDIAVLFLILIAELARMAFETFPTYIGGSEARIRPSEAVGKVTWRNSVDGHVSLQHAISVTNLSKASIKISGASLNVLFFRRLPVELYSPTSPDEITDEHPLPVDSNDVAELRFVCRDTQKAFKFIIGMIKTLRLRWLLDISGTIFLYGHDALPSRGRRVIFYINV